MDGVGETPGLRGDGKGRPDRNDDAYLSVAEDDEAGPGVEHAEEL